MAMACRESGTSEKVNQLKEVIRQLRGAVFMLKDQIEESFVSRLCEVSVKIKMNRFDTPNSDVSRKIPKFISNVLKKRIYIVN